MKYMAMILNLALLSLFLCTGCFHVDREVNCRGLVASEKDISTPKLNKDKSVFCITNTNSNSKKILVVFDGYLIHSNLYDSLCSQEQYLDFRKIFCVESDTSILSYKIYDNVDLEYRNLEFIKNLSQEGHYTGYYDNHMAYMKEILPQLIEESEFYSSEIYLFGYSNSAPFVLDLCSQFSLLAESNVVLYSPVGEFISEPAMDMNKPAIEILNGMDDPLPIRDIVMQFDTAVRKQYDNTSYIEIKGSHDRHSYLNVILSYISSQ